MSFFVKFLLWLEFGKNIKDLFLMNHNVWFRNRVGTIVDQNKKVLNQVHSIKYITVDLFYPYCACHTYQGNVQ